jgi:hypothetical protein
MSCGNPDAGLQAKVDFTAPSASGSILSTVGFVDNLLTYNPATLGPISSINASFDRLVTSNVAFSIPLTARLIIQQGGSDYVTAINSPGIDTGGVWHTLTLSGLMASDFLLFNFGTGVGGSAHPDFAGGQMTFGIGAIIATDAGETRIASFDNLGIDVIQTPLPAALPLFATGLGALGLLGWRRKRKGTTYAVCA